MNTHTHTHTHTGIPKTEFVTESVAKVIYLKREIPDEYVTIRSDQGNLLKPV